MKFSKAARRSAAHAESVSLTAADGARLAGLWHPGPSGRTFVVSHGFSHSTAEPSTRAVIQSLARHGSVLAMDFRGHGKSEGLATVGRDEPLDTSAAIACARTRTDDRIVSIGFSMGGAVVIRQAAETPDARPDAVVAVSPATRWYIRDNRQMRRVHWLLEHPLGHAVGRLIGVRLGDTWPDVPPSPLEQAHRVPVPFLVIQGTSDRYFTPEHAAQLHRASAGRAELWIEPGMTHAEAGTSDELVDRIAAWATDALVGTPSPGKSDPTDSLPEESAVPPRLP